MNPKCCPTCKRPYPKPKAEKIDLHESRRGIGEVHSQKCWKCKRMLYPGNRCYEHVGMPVVFCELCAKSSAKFERMLIDDPQAACDAQARFFAVDWRLREDKLFPAIVTA